MEAERAAYRRFVAVQLVQIATGFQMEEAARFPGIPDGWHQAPVQQRKLHSRSRHRSVRNRIRHRTSPYYLGLAELINQVAAAERQA